MKWQGRREFSVFSRNRLYMATVAERRKTNSWLDRHLTGDPKSLCRIDRTEFADASPEAIRGMFYDRALQRGLKASVSVGRNEVTVRSVDLAKAEIADCLLTHLDFLRAKVRAGDFTDGDAVVRKIADAWDFLKG